MKDSTYWDHNARGIEALHQARFSEAEEEFTSARREALARRLSGLAERTYCNWVATRIARGQTTGLREGLSRILGQSADDKARQLASYYLAVTYYNQGNIRAAQLYVEMSERQAGSLRDRRSQASSLHLLGLLRMREGNLSLAAQYLQRSMEASISVGEYRTALVTMSTLGYCLSLKGSLNESLWMLEEAQETLTVPDWKVYEPAVRLNLGFSFLEMGDLDESIEQGQAVLSALGEGSLAVEAKFAYYLLGEAHAQKESDEEAKACFDILQKTFYPQYPGISETLLDVRTSRWLNWLGR
jgi:tetratricopeptide (TPR) repeat protein